MNGNDLSDFLKYPIGLTQSNPSLAQTSQKALESVSFLNQDIFRTVARIYLFHDCTDSVCGMQYVNNES